MASSATHLRPDPTSQPFVFYSKMNAFLLRFETMYRQSQDFVNEHFENILSEQGISNDAWHEASTERIKKHLKAGIEIKTGKDTEEFIQCLAVCVPAMKNCVDIHQGLANMTAEDVKRELFPKITFLASFFDFNCSNAKEVFIRDAQYYFNIYFSLITYSAVYIPKNACDIKDPQKYVKEAWEQTHKTFILWHRQLIQDYILASAHPTFSPPPYVLKLRLYPEQNKLTINANPNPSIDDADLTYGLNRNKHGKMEILVAVYSTSSEETTTNNKNRKRGNNKIKTGPDARYKSFNDNNATFQQPRTTQISTDQRYGRHKYRNKNASINKKRSHYKQHELVKEDAEMKDSLINHNEEIVHKIDRIHEINLQRHQTTLARLASLKNEVQQLKTVVLQIKQQESDKDQLITELTSRNDQLSKALNEKNAQIQALQRVLQQTPESQTAIASETTKTLDYIDINDGNYADHDGQYDYDADHDGIDTEEYDNNQHNDLKNPDGMIKVTEYTRKSNAYSSLSSFTSPSHPQKCKDIDSTDDNDEEIVGMKETKASNPAPNKNIRSIDQSSDDSTKESSDESISNTCQMEEDEEEEEYDSYEKNGSSYEPGDPDEDDKEYSKYSFS